MIGIRSFSSMKAFSLYNSGFEELCLFILRLLTNISRSATFITFHNFTFQHLFSLYFWVIFYCNDLPGFILTVEEGRWEVEPGEKLESTVEEEWWEWRGGGERGRWGGRGWWG